jgi:hypothetical protein
MVSNAFKAAVPWQIKLASKIVLSRLPVPYDAWRSLNLFRDGTMDDPASALASVRCAMAAAGLGQRLDGLNVLELGPGDAVSTAVIAAALGARETILVDARPHARRDMAFYRSLVSYLAEQGLAVERFAKARTMSELLDLCNAQYLTSGLQDLEKLPPCSIDFVFSIAVLEHIRLKEFTPTIEALARAMAPGARAYHNIDLMDHLGGALNNLRFSNALWESEFMARSGFYTNRIRMGSMLEIFARAGLACDIQHVSHFPAIPTDRSKLSLEFRDLPEKELLVAWFNVVWTRAADPLSIGIAGRPA